MCTNYRPSSREVALDLLGADPGPESFPPETYPGYASPMVRRAAPGSRDGGGGFEREGLLGRFGLIPHWAKDASIARHTYNARAETVGEKPSFRDAWRRGQRCIVPMDWFYEPHWGTGKAVRWRIQHPEGAPLMVAAIWARWQPPGRPAAPAAEVISFSLLTLNADAHPVMKQFHKPGEEKRMLALLPKAELDAWLHAPPAQAAALIRPWPDLVCEPAPKSAP